MFVPRASGLHGLVKDGSKHLTGLEEAVLKNVEASKKISEITRTSLGPNGMKKLVVNKHNKLLVTSDAATILTELEVVHPAANMLVMASKMQEAEMGDGTNFVIVFAGALLSESESLIRMGLHPSEIIQGYTKASQRTIEILPSLVVETCTKTRDIAAVARVLRSILGSKVPGWEDVLAPMVAEAAIATLPTTPSESDEFHVEDVRVCKVIGCGVGDSKLVRGLALVRDSEGVVKSVKNAKVAVLATGIDFAKTEAKATVKIQSGKELEEFSTSEERVIEETVRKIAETGANVIVSGGPVGELALHYMERFKMMVIKIQSKFDLRRVCQACHATPLVRLGAPTAEEMGTCESVEIEEVGGTQVCVFRGSGAGLGRLTTLLVRASTENVLDDTERAIDGAVNAYRQLCVDGRLLAGAGAVEAELARRLRAYGESQAGLEQYGIKKFADALEVFPRTLAENAGFNVQAVLAALYAAHEQGKATACVGNIDDGNTSKIADAVTDFGVFDLFRVKASALKLAVEAAVDILRVDQIIMAKRAGGPVLPRDQAQRDDA